MDKPKYVIAKYADGASTLSRIQLEATLQKIPILINVRTGHELTLDALAGPTGTEAEPILQVQYGASLIILKPEPGNRLEGAGFYENNNLFVPSRIMDEDMGGGACCSYSFNTKKLGLPFEYDHTLDIHKFG